MSADSLVMSIPEVARALGISRGLGYKLAKRNELPVKVIRIGERRMFVSKRALEDLLSSGQSEKADQE